MLRAARAGLVPGVSVVASCSTPSFSATGTVEVWVSVGGGAVGATTSVAGGVPVCGSISVTVSIVYLWRAVYSVSTVVF